MKIRQPTDVEKQEIERLLCLDSQLLFEELGKASEIYVEPSPSILRDPAYYVRTGEIYYLILQGVYAEVLCIEWDLCEKTEDPLFADSTNLIIAIADVIEAKGVVEFVMPVLLIATVIVKLGAINFCSRVK